MKTFSTLSLVSVFFAALSNGLTEAAPVTLRPVSSSKDGRQFVFAGTDQPFRPWGFNYDHDRANRLLEDYWETDWDTVESDFREMKALGANCVRIHLQVGRFMTSTTETNAVSLAQLARLLRLAEATGLYLDVTGLGCYEKQQVPKWYNDLDESERWAVQGRFWEAVAATGVNSPAVFCYDLMNEPVVSEDKQGREWTPGEFGGKNFVQRLSLHPAGRTEQAIAQAWVEQMAAAIHKHDRCEATGVGSPNLTNRQPRAGSRPARHRAMAPGPWTSGDPRPIKPPGLPRVRGELRRARTPNPVVGAFKATLSKSEI